jgi:hypothetical protein
VQHLRAVAILTLSVLAIVVVAVAMTQSTRSPRILVFTKTAGFRHSSIPTAVSAVRQLAEHNGLAVDATEDAAAFTPFNLARYDAVVFLMTTGDVLNDGQQRAFERYFRRGGGFVGVHSAADTEYDWTWYGAMLGTRFKNHPQIQRAAISVQDRRHPSTHGLPRRWFAPTSGTTSPRILGVRCMCSRRSTNRRTPREKAPWAPITPLPGRMSFKADALGSPAADTRTSPTWSLRSGSTSSAESVTPQA